jgi:hypothetical protein
VTKQEAVKIRKAPGPEKSVRLSKRRTPNAQYRMRKGLSGHSIGCRAIDWR